MKTRFLRIVETAFCATIFAFLTISCSSDNEDWKIDQHPNGSYILKLTEPHLEQITVVDFNNTTIATDNNLTGLVISMGRDLIPRVLVLFLWNGEIRQTYEIQTNPNLFCFFRDFDSASEYKIENNRNVIVDDNSISVEFGQEESKAIIRYLHQGSYISYAFTTGINKKRLMIRFDNLKLPISLNGFDKLYQKFLEKNKDLEYDEYTGMFKKRH